MFEPVIPDSTEWTAIWPETMAVIMKLDNTVQIDICV